MRVVGVIDLEGYELGRFDRRLFQIMLTRPPSSCGRDRGLGSDLVQRLFANKTRFSLDSVLFRKYRVCLATILRIVVL